MTGAGRLSSGPEPVTASAAPLFLSCIVYRRRRRKFRSRRIFRQGWEARRVKTRLKPGFQRQPTARSRRETANHWAAAHNGLVAGSCSAGPNTKLDQGFFALDGSAGNVPRTTVIVAGETLRPKRSVGKREGSRRRGSDNDAGMKCPQAPRRLQSRDRLKRHPRSGQ
jgi:hypothetical protein